MSEVVSTHLPPTRIEKLSTRVTHRNQSQLVHIFPLLLFALLFFPSSTLPSRRYSLRPLPSVMQNVEFGEVKFYVMKDIDAEFGEASLTSLTAMQRSKIYGTIATAPTLVGTNTLVDGLRTMLNLRTAMEPDAFDTGINRVISDYHKVNFPPVVAINEVAGNAVPPTTVTAINAAPSSSPAEDSAAATTSNPLPPPPPSNVLAVAGPSNSAIVALCMSVLQPTFLIPPIVHSGGACLSALLVFKGFLRMLARCTRMDYQRTTGAENGGMKYTVECVNPLCTGGGRFRQVGSIPDAMAMW